MHPNSSNFATQLRRAVGPPDGSDGQLLEQYLTGGNNAAFAALVRRHGPMVLGVCRRVVADTHLADDAFQAVCLILARKAATVRPREAVGNWLYGVAYRVALRARTMAGRRRQRETLVAAVPDRSDSVPDAAESAELAAALDAEVARLSNPLRTAVVLCELEGRSRKEVALELGIPEGTLSSRLAAARKLLADRLGRQGIVLPAAGLLIIANPLVSPELLAAGTGAEVSKRVLTLAQGIFRAMFLKKLGFGVGMLVLLAAGISVVASWAGTDKAPRSAPTPPAGVDPAVPTSATKAPASSQLLVWKGEGFVYVTPDGKEGERLPGRVDGLILNEPVISPDGKRVAFTANDNPPADADGFLRRKVFIRDLHGTDTGRMFAINALDVFWSPDGELYCVESVPSKDWKDRVRRVSQVQPATGTKKAIDLPQECDPSAITPDGKAFVAAAPDLWAQPRKIYLALVLRGDTTNVTRQTEIRTKSPNPRVSPDGNRILYRDVDPADWPEKDMPSLPRLFVYDRSTKTRTRLAEIPQNALVIGYCWSPDGQKVAYTWRRIRPGLALPHYTESVNEPKLATSTESFLVIADADGKNPKTVLSGTAETAGRTNIGTVDWR